MPTTHAHDHPIGIGVECRKCGNVGADADSGAIAPSNGRHQSGLEYAGEYVKGEQTERLGQLDPWAALSMLWPPRLIGALAERKVAGFFGAGMSLAAGAPPWGTLLTQYFRLDDEILQDRDLGDDPLTLAQLAAEKSATSECSRSRARRWVSTPSPPLVTFCWWR
jgi:hypothetical protein